MKNKTKIKLDRILRQSLLCSLSFYLVFGLTGFAVTNNSSWFGSAFAFGPTDPECFELGTCNFFERPFDAMIEPYNATLGDFSLVAIWAIILGVLWLRVSNTMLVAMIGIALAALFTQGFSEDAQVIGYGLLAVAITVALYQLFVVRLSYPTN